MKRYLLLILIIFSFTLQSQTWEWAKNYAIGAQNCGNSIGTDNSQNLYVAGFARYSTGGSGSYHYEILWKFNPTGNLLWSDTLPMQDTKIAVDSFGNSYLAGGRIGKYDAAGNPLWLQTPSVGGFYNISTLPQGGIVVVGLGNFAGTMKGILARYDENGNCIWTKIGEFPPGISSQPIALTVDQYGNIYVAGGGYLDSVTGNRGFLSKYDINGNQLFYRIIPHFVNDIEIDQFENIYLTGWFSIHPVNIDGTIFTADIQNSETPQFLIKYDHSGNILWYKVMRGQYVSCFIDLDKSGNIFFTIAHNGFTIDSLSFTAAVNTSKLLIMKLNTNGNVQWVTNSTGLTNGSGAWPAALCFSKNNIYVSGGMNVSNSFGPFTLNQTSMYSDLLIAKLKDEELVSVNQNFQDYSMAIYPNPSGDNFNLICSGISCKALILSVKNNLGQTVYSVSESNIGSEYQKSIDLSQQNKGIYFIEIIADEKRKVKKVILQ